MSYLFLPLFVLHLLLSSAPSLFLLLIAKALPYRSLLIPSSLLIVTVISFFYYLFSTPTSPPLDPKVELLTQKNQLESWQQKQPTHRDILLNLSKINQKLGNESQSLELKKQAQQLDPNHSIFTGN